jgi:hypothetical protein
MLVIKILSLLLLGNVYLESGTQLKVPLSSRTDIKWVVEKSSSLRVAGSSNINNFTCNIYEYIDKDTIVFAKDPSRSVKLSGEIQMDILSFDCHSKMITKDLRKTLKAEQYPKIVIRFISLQSMPLMNMEKEYIKGMVEVQLAGIIKRFELQYIFLKSGPGILKLNGGRRFQFSDFKLSPPRKLAGLIKIKDGFDVNFQLNLRSL